MKESKQEKLQKELAEFFTKKHEEYKTGVGFLALDLGNDGEVILGMLFGAKNNLNDSILNRIKECCDRTINGAKIEYLEGKKQQKIRLEDLPDPDDKKATLKWLVENDMLDEDGEINHKKLDKVLDGIIEDAVERVKKGYIDDCLKGLKD